MSYFVWNEFKDEYMETFAAYCGPSYLPEPYESLLERDYEQVEWNPLEVGPKPLTIGALPPVEHNWLVFELPKIETKETAPVVQEEPVVETKSHQWVAAAWEPTEDKLVDLAREMKTDKVHGPLESAILKLFIPRSEPRSVYSLLWNLATLPPTVGKYVEWVLANRPQPTFKDFCVALHKPEAEWPSRRGQQINLLKQTCRGIFPPDFPFERTVIGGEVRFGMLIQAAEKFRRSGPPQHQQNQNNRGPRPDDRRRDDRRDGRDTRPKDGHRDTREHHGGGQRERDNRPRDNPNRPRDNQQAPRKGGRPDEKKEQQRLLPRPPMKK